MRSLIVAVASALLLAVVVTTFAQYFFPESSLALFITAAIALLINGLFNQKLGLNPVSAPAASSGNQTGRDNRDNAKRDAAPKKPRDNNRNNERNNDRNNDRNNARKKPGNAAAAAPASVPSGPREQGEVKWFNRSKGFGFIIRESGDEIFVHQRSIRGADDSRSRPVLRDGEAVEFVVTEHDKGLQAEDVVATGRN